MVDFVRHFGPSVFAIWKSVVLRQRILFHSPPPIKDACAHVYCANMISFTHVAKMRWDANPLFYVNINDMKMLNEQEIFIACTTESIFQKKFNIYDIYIAQHTFHTPSKETLLPLRTTAGDRLRYQRLLHIISAHPDPREAGELILKCVVCTASYVIFPDLCVCVCVCFGWKVLPATKRQAVRRLAPGAPGAYFCVRPATAIWTAHNRHLFLLRCC